jgi:hypothetical protein
MAIQKTLDYACGAGADCLPIHQKGACYEPDTVTSHCSYAANSFFQKNGQQAQACDFSGTATITSKDPSKQSFPSTQSALLSCFLPICSIQMKQGLNPFVLLQ